MFLRTLAANGEFDIAEASGATGTAAAVTAGAGGTTGEVPPAIPAGCLSDELPAGLLSSLLFRLPLVAPPSASSSFTAEVFRVNNAEESRRVIS